MNSLNLPELPDPGKCHHQGCEEDGFISMAVKRLTSGHLCIVVVCREHADTAVEKMLEVFDLIEAQGFEAVERMAVTAAVQERDRKERREEV